MLQQTHRQRFPQGRICLSGKYIWILCRSSATSESDSACKVTVSYSSTVVLNSEAGLMDWANAMNRDGIS